MEPLETMVAVGLVDDTSVCIWIRVHRAGTITVSWSPENDEDKVAHKDVHIPYHNSADNTVSVALPEEGEQLLPLTRYTFSAVHQEDNRLLGEGAFETFPATAKDTPERFTIGLTSCHQPFTEDGAIQQDASEMLTAVKRCMMEHNTKFLLMGGDQMYADFPEPLSLFNKQFFNSVGPAGKERLRDCSTEEIRLLYQDRYRIFWNHPEWQKLQAEYPCLPILDDHDILDNWGSRPVYQCDDWQRVGLGARWAYYDYQHRRIGLYEKDGALASSFHYSFSYGNTATFVMDLRSERTAGEGGQLYSPEQQNDLESFLSENSAKKVLFIVLSVPIIHLPRWIAKFVAKLPHTGEDFSDRWSTGNHINDRDRLLKILHDHNNLYPQQKIILLSGDIHIGCVHVIKWHDGGPNMYQFISSPVTHRTPWYVQLGSKMLIKANRNVMTQGKRVEADVRLLESSAKNRQNPYGGRNLGMVEVYTPSPGADPEVRFLMIGREGEKPVCVYRSDPI